MTGPPRAPRILITAGPTREPLDPVRFISNASSGRQGVALAADALRRGWSVDLVHGPLEVPVPEGAACHAVTTATEMLEACRALHPSCDLLVGAAAVSDFRPRGASTSKRKRGTEVWTLELVPTEDILKVLGVQKGSRVHAGFALESENLIENALAKLHGKRLDWIIANTPGAIGAGMSRCHLLGADGTQKDLGVATKAEVAQALLDAMAGSRGLH